MTAKPDMVSPYIPKSGELVIEAGEHSVAIQNSLESSYIAVASLGLPAQKSSSDIECGEDCRVMFNDRPLRLFRIRDY